MFNNDALFDNFILIDTFVHDKKKSYQAEKKQCFD